MALPERRSRRALARVLPAALVAACALALGAGATTGPAAAATNPCAPPRVTNFLAADSTHPGTITLYFFHADGAPVTYYECVRGKARRLGSRTSAPGDPTIMRDATTWSCDRLTRRFAAAATLPDGSAAAGTYSVRTVSCGQRFEIEAPSRVAAGARLAVRVIDRWGIGGIRTRLCITPPGARRQCSPLAFPKAVGVASRRFRANTRGRVRVELRVRDRRVRSTAVAVGVERARAQAARPSVLATGDSMMQGIDGFLADDLGEAMPVHSDVRAGTAISKSLDWLRWADEQVTQLHPAATVIAIGPNEGWPMDAPGGARVECCDEPWVAEYSRRVATMMATYLRRGRGRVLWLTLPAPRSGRLVPIIDAVNRAILRAGTGVPGVTVLRMDLLFTPDGYRDVMRYRGHDVRVREPDGVHLNVSGTAIAATAIAAALRAG